VARRTSRLLYRGTETELEQFIHTSSLPMGIGVGIGIGIGIGLLQPERKCPLLGQIQKPIPIPIATPTPRKPAKWRVALPGSCSAELPDRLPYPPPEGQFRRHPKVVSRCSDSATPRCKLLHSRNISAHHAYITPNHLPELPRRASFAPNTSKAECRELGVLPDSVSRVSFSDIDLAGVSS
jgi:hypothetical protein